MLNNCSCYLSYAEFFSKSTLKKSEIHVPPEWQAARKQFRPNVLSYLIWVQVVCKGNPKTTPLGKELNILLDFSLSVKAAPHECEIRASQP